MINADSFLPFFGVVENNTDPEKLGRVQVRCYGHHTRNKEMIPTDTLPWFTCVIGNSASVSGIGNSPTEYVNGSTVFGFFVDRTFQHGIVMGAINGIPYDTPKTNLGFNDPDGMWPNYANESDVNRLAREDGDSHWMYEIKDQNRITGIQGPLRKGGWEEPPYKNGVQYPHNKVRETTSGHVFEVDDTPGSERIHEYHRSGTYQEIDASGNKVVKIVGDGYEIIAGDKYASVKGSLNLTVDSNCNTYIKGDWNIQVDGDKTEVVQGSSKEFHMSGHDIQVKGAHNVNANAINMNEG